MKERKPVMALFLCLLSIAVTFIFHYLAIHLYLYWTADWIDTLIHFLGGLTTGFFFIWFATSIKFEVTTLSVFIFGLVIGIGWEIFEYSSGLTFYSPFFIFDTWRTCRWISLAVFLLTLLLMRN